MKKLLYASKGWKKLQKEYIDENCFAQRSQKLAAVSQQDVTGFSYEEMIIHYGFIWSSALNCNCSYRSISMERRFFTVLFSS